MATGEQLTERVLDKVQDPSFEDETVLSRLNEGLLVMAGMVLLPGLEDAAQVDTVLGDHMTDLPENYHRGLYKAQDPVDGRPIGVLKSRSQMMERYFDLGMDGMVYDVCVVDGRLMYQHVPAQVTPISIFYYRRPATLAEDTEPDGFNRLCRTMGEEAMFHYACWKMFELIEDGIEGQKVNTAYHKNEFLELVGEVRIKIRADGSVSRPAPPVVRGCFQ